jgi:hypothetical protein
MRGVQPVGRGLVDAGEETAEWVLLAEREEPLQQTALVHHLDAARVQSQRADIPGRRYLLLQHERLHAVQPQTHWPASPRSVRRRQRSRQT